VKYVRRLADDARHERLGRGKRLAAKIAVCAAPSCDQPLPDVPERTDHGQPQQRLCDPDEQDGQRTAHRGFGMRSTVKLVSSTV